ncbi:uncharacterized protein LACBIDRAFT_315681 [Laccaria bicolor S238N-H82]|uniref:Predicted protein n=1 Tax=Laccaria bicolor (strain S238N-H82 / ATCC MYA-4686) TaxID=486041 RepID=B0D2X5_LACBS|nr:uncharacterized protein LACBIDRAFT_315681 [Laccaria bicolor S238N-H82]EDR11172.1 predicted protein [Laccaria bicolor S238N-H82]|eukprot:XP_001878473.1 predicted protein [Laccaria bicolor S238N-H82]
MEYLRWVLRTVLAFSTPWRVYALNVSALKEPMPPDHENDSAVVASETVSDTPAQRKRIINLPTEILLLVFEAMDSPDLYTTAFLSRNFHHLALPMYLARYGISASAEANLILFNDWSPEALRAVHAALFLPSVNRLKCVFDFYKPYDQVRREVHAFRRFLGKLASVREIHIEIVRYGMKGGANAPFASNDEPVGLTEEWGRELVQMLDSVVGSGCAELSLSLAGRCDPPAQELERLLLGEFYGFYGMLKHPTFRGFAAGFGRACVRARSLVGVGQPNQSQKRGLETLDLHSSMFFHPLLLRWMMSTLNSMSITSLSLRQLDHISPQNWALLLPCITLPSLSKLSVNLCYIQTHVLYHFLYRHPHIQDLTLGRSCVGPGRVVLRTGILGELEHLSAPPSYLVALLTPPGSLPALKTVCIRWHVRNERVFEASAVDKILLPISQRLRQLDDLRFLLSFESLNVSSWFQPSGLDISPLQYISHLELKIHVYSLPLNTMTGLARWLVGFSRLRCLELTTVGQDGLEVEERVLFFEAIGKWCPSVEVVQINKDVFTAPF